MITAIKSLSVALALSAGVVALSNQAERNPETIAQSQVDRPVIYQIAQIA